MLDHLRLVHDLEELDVGGQGFLDVLELGLDGLADQGGVGPGPLADHEIDGLLALDPADKAGFLQSIPDIGHIPDVNRLALGRGADDRVADVVQRFKLADRPDEKIRMPLDQIAGGHVHVSGHQGPEDAVERQAEGGQGVLVHVHQDFPGVHGKRRRRGDAVEALEPPGDLVLDDGFQLGHGSIADNAPENDRDLGHVELDDERIARRLRQEALVKPDSVADVLGGEIEVGPPFEFDLNRRRPLGRDRRDLLDAVDRADDALQRLGDEVFDVLRRGASISRDDGDSGIFEVGEEIQPESRERNHPDDDQDQGDHGRRNAAFDGKIRELHG